MVDHESDEYEVKAPSSKFRSFLMRNWPYLLKLALALAGVARTSIGQSAIATYWVALAPCSASSVWPSIGETSRGPRHIGNLFGHRHPLDCGYVCNVSRIYDERRENDELGR